MSFMALRTRALVFAQAAVPRWLSTGLAPSAERYFWIEVEPRQRNVEPRALGVLQQHEFRCDRRPD